MSDLEVWDASPPVIWLVVGVVVAIFLAIGLMGVLYQPDRQDAICSRSEAHCGDN